MPAQKGFARFGHKQEFVEMEKPDGHRLTDVTNIQSCGKLVSDLSSKPSSGRRELLIDLNTVEGQSEASDHEILLKKRKLKKDESISKNGFKNNNHINLEPSLTSLRLPGSNTNNGTHKQGDPSLPLKKKFILALPSESDFNGRSTSLILMSCFNCYLLVMVCDNNPKCPKCKKGDSLLDIFRESQVAKKARTVWFR